MQNTTQTAILKSLAKTPYSARFPLNALQSNLFLTHSKKISVRENQNYAPSSQNGDHSTIYFEKTRTINTNEDCILIKRNGYRISIVNSLKQRIKTSTLIKRMYASRGYHTENSSTFSYNPNQIIFQASLGEITAGTVTLGIDSDKGLLADELYHQEINSFREKGSAVCELAKFALDPQYSSKEIIASLFQAAYLYAHNVHKATDIFCEVNPRHAAPHKRLFGFRQISESRTCTRVNAPAVLLHLKCDYIHMQTSSLRNPYKYTEKSIYPYFLPQIEEKIIVDKIGFPEIAW